MSASGGWLIAAGCSELDMDGISRMSGSGRCFEWASSSGASGIK